MQHKPWYYLECLDLAVDQLMAKTHGLKEVPCQNFTTMQSLIQTLREKGPLMVIGKFGKHFYANEPEAIPLAAKIGEHPLYGWKKGTLISEERGIRHAIVLVGAEVKAERQYVYWIDPEDPNDPQLPFQQRIYVSSFEAISNRMTAIIGLPLEQMTVQSKAVLGGAFYNPLYCQKV